MIASSLVFTQVVQEHRWCNSQKDGRVLWMLNSSWAWRLCPQWHADYMPKKPCAVELWALGLYEPVAGILATWHIYLSTWHFLFFFFLGYSPSTGWPQQETNHPRAIDSRRQLRQQISDMSCGLCGLFCFGFPSYLALFLSSIFSPGL